MKKYLKNHYAVLTLSLLIILIFVFGGMFSRYMTNQIDVHAEAEELRVLNESLIALAGVGDEVVVFESEQLTKEYLLPESETETYQPELLNAYKILENDEEVSVIYVISTHGKYDGLEVAYAIDIATKTLIDVKVMNNNETPGYYSALDDAFFGQLSNKTFDDAVFTIDAVSGSTYTSKAFETGMKYARELFARDFDFEIPIIVYTINWIERNYDSATFITKPFIANITYGAENNVLEAYFDNEYNLVEVISGVEPDQTYKDVFKTDFPTTTFIDVKTFITAYDETTRVITIETIAYGRKALIVEFELNATLDQVMAMSITTTQTYDSVNNEDYTGGALPALENAYRDQYLLDGSYLDSISGATITSNAIIRIFTLMDNVLTEWGGN
jgi:Na+-translocating ferredoxin:NAD+ oxidoreductase RnfG subunit